MIADGRSHRDEGVVGPSDRSFGLTFGCIFLAVGLLPLWRGGAPRGWALIVAALCLVAASVRPRILAPANRIWFRIGLLLHRVVNPVVMAAIYYLAVTPCGLLTRLFGTAMAQRLRPDPAAPTYWIPRSDTPSRMDQQF